MITSLQMFIPELSPWNTLVMSIKTYIYTKFSCGAFGFELLLLFSHCKLCHSLQPHRLQHIRLPCPTLSPGVCSNSYPLSQWCHLTITYSVSPFSSCPQSLPVSGYFPMSWLFSSGGQSIGMSASVLPVNIQGWFPWGLTGLISFLSKGLSRVCSSNAIQKDACSLEGRLWQT